MPPLADSINRPIAGPTQTPLAHALHPSPTHSRLALEELSAREVAWHGHRFGIDTPYVVFASGWGELLPAYGADALEFDPLNPPFVIVPV